MLLMLLPLLLLLPAAAGLNGLVDAVEPGLACGSDTSHMNILGYDPRK
jgi:2,3-bisphosphoglycerate-independent phosphoglycerate mutase